MIDMTDSPVRDLWRIFRVMAEFTEGFEELASVGPAVSIFGSARSKPDDPYFKLAEQTASELANAGFAVITGGGGGIMEAANKGAADAGGQSIGLNIELPMGGYGTMDEFFESLVLIQTLKQATFPVILMGSDYWAGLVDWIKTRMLGEHKYIAPEDLDVFTMADDPKDAVKIIVDFKEGPGRSGIELPPGMRKI